MQYNVSINEKTKTITVELDGYKGVAKCCPTDSFNISTGIELALERAKAAKAEASKPTTKPMGVMELVKALEKALPKGQMVLVGNGDELTKSQKEWLASLAGVSLDDYECDCDCYGDLSEAYDDGYADGYRDGKDEAEESASDVIEVIMGRIREALEDAVL
jgi:predicted CopG family antitoxin